MEDTAQPSELELLKMKMNAKTDESLESTRRMVKMAEESQDTGVRTMQMLGTQREQLDHVNEDMDHINEDMKETEKNLDDLNKCCGLCVLPWNRRKRGGQYKTPKSDVPMTSQPVHYAADQNGKEKVTIKSDGQYITRITHDAREDEMERNLQDVSGVVGNLRSMAVDMNSELTQHNRIIDDITAKAEESQFRIKAADKEATKHLKS